MTFRDYIDTNCHHLSSLVTTPSMKNGCSSYKHLIDRDFDLVLQLAQVATRQIEDTDIRAHILDPTQASKAVDLSRDLHYIFINICQGAAVTVVRPAKPLQRKRMRNTATPTPQVQPTSRNKKRWLPYQTTGPYIQRSAV